MGAEVEPVAEEWFGKCPKGSGPHGHIARTQRQWAGRPGSGKAIFTWECTQCGQQSKVASVVFVDRHGCVL
jgi:hypothetical protein